jgi:hypothetical protein
MFSGPLEKTILSAAAGIVIGLADAACFYYTVKFFLVNASGRKKTLAGFFEFFRFIVFIALIIFLCSHRIIFIIPFFLSAVILSLGGKMLFIFKGLKK